jgi:TPR repeat protein
MRCLRENPQTPTLYATAEKIAPKSTAWRFAFESARLSLFSKNPQAADELLTQKDYLLNSPEMFYLSATTFYEKGSFIFCYEQCLDYFAVHKHNKLTPKFIALSELALAKCRETKLEEHQLKQLAELTPPHVIFGKGAEEDHVNTLLNLANCYKYQINDLDNPKEQTRLFLLAAEKGDADAQYEVGQAYLNGTGLPTNEKKAMHWLKTASKNGHEQAKKELKSAKKAAASE